MDEDLPAPDPAELSPRMAAIVAYAVRQAFLIDRAAKGSITIGWHLDAPIAGSITIGGYGLDPSQDRNQ